MHKIDKHTGLYLEWGGPYLSPVVEDMEATKNEHPYEAHIMSKSGLFVDDVRKPQEPPEFNSAADDGGTKAALDLFDSINSKELLKDIFSRAGMSFYKHDHLYNRIQVEMYPHAFVKAYHYSLI